MKKSLFYVLIMLLLLNFSSVFAGPKICIDAGHGGSDPGASKYATEKSLTLTHAKGLEAWLVNDSREGMGGYTWSPYMPRKTDTTVSLAARVEYANRNNVSRFISIHANAFSSPSANGSETYCYPNVGSTTIDLRNKIHKELISHGKLRDRGTKTGNFYVLRNTKMSAVLVELGFVTNRSDAEKMKSYSWRKNVTLGFLHALQQHYNKETYTPEYSYGN